MNKTKLAICMKDLEYQERFVNCFMNHYNHQYELHVFTSQDSLQIINPAEYAVIITGEYSTDQLAKFVERGQILLNLTENIEESKESVEEKITYTEKYQEVYKIAEILERLLAEQTMTQGQLQETAYECIGVYSLNQEVYQMPFVALLGKTLGEKQKVMVLDLQSYSGLGIVAEGMATMGLEDLLSAATTGNYSKSRILECIRHEPLWDYVCPVQNHQCLAEGTQELYETLIGLLVQEIGYQKIIINFGSVFLGKLELMQQCQRIYMLCSKDTGGTWREESFQAEISRQGKEELLQRMRRIEIPSAFNHEINGMTLVEKWSWGPLGELLRQEAERKQNHGATM
ncbi:MAG: hypothetical protein IJ455_04510 [Agathobacter sp.]|nr:hypothetical protein [Agathobacter sp.]